MPFASNPFHQRLSFFLSSIRAKDTDGDNELDPIDFYTCMGPRCPSTSGGGRCPGNCVQRGICLGIAPDVPLNSNKTRKSAKENVVIVSGRGPEGDGPCFFTTVTAQLEGLCDALLVV